ncbi:hypothetical protein BLOT_004060 [Blomia tropicalis]|nr:hypothetical protein BLOT_004060 [Blomia tropicalis]
MVPYIRHDRQQLECVVVGLESQPLSSEDNQLTNDMPKMATQCDLKNRMIEPKKKSKNEEAGYLKNVNSVQSTSNTFSFDHKFINGSLIKNTLRLDH